MGTPHWAYHPTGVWGSHGDHPHAVSRPLSAGAGVGGVPGGVPGVAGVPGVTPGVGVVPGLVPGVGIPGTGILPGAGTCFVTSCLGTRLGTAVAGDAKSHRAVWRVAGGHAGGMGDGGTWEGCRDDCPNRGVLIHFAGIPQIGVQPGAKPPKFGTYLCHSAPGPPWTVTRRPPHVAIGVLASLCVPCMPPDVPAEGGPGVGGGVLSPVGAKCHLCPLPWTRWGHFSPALHCLQQCVMQGVSPLQVFLLWVL